MDAGNSADAVVCRIANAIGEPARTRMLLTLMDGYARTSTELAMLAEVAPSTASVHLNRLRDERLISVSAQGRHRYYSLQSLEVARALEGLSVLAGGAAGRFVPGTPEPLRKARTCYDHIAGALSVAVHDHFFNEGWLTRDRRNGGRAYQVTFEGTKRLKAAGLDVDGAHASRRKFAYGCLDWSERRLHLAGALGAALLGSALARKWVTRDLNSRALHITRLGEREIKARWGLELMN